MFFYLKLLGLEYDECRNLFTIVNKDFLVTKFFGTFF